MPKKCVQVTNMHGYTLEDLIKLSNETNSKYTRTVLTAIIMRLEDIHTSKIAKTLGKCVATITNYINRWNEFGIESIYDHRGGSEGTTTEAMVKDIYDIVVNNAPKDFGYNQNNWNTRVLKRYIKDNYGQDYSTEWIRQILLSLGFTYKRGVYKPTKANPELQEAFKKNEYVVGYN